MFAYDRTLLSDLQVSPHSIAEVIQTMQMINATCVDSDGLKWFNWLYLQVTQAVEAKITSGGFTDPAWLVELDLQFARLYFEALQSALSSGPYPDCWQALFSCRNVTALARVQFAVAGINAHINRDLPQAVVSTCKARGTSPQQATAQYADYTNLNTTLDSLIELAKQKMHVRLLGDSLPPISRIEDAIAAWNVGAAREGAWRNAELLWQLQGLPLLASNFMQTLDGLTTVISKTLLIPV